MATFSVNNDTTGIPNFSPQSLDIKVKGQVWMKSVADGALQVYTWIGVPSDTNLPKPIFKEGGSPYTAPTGNGAAFNLLTTIPANTVLTLSIYPTGTPPAAPAAPSTYGGTTGRNGTINVKP